MYYCYFQAPFGKLLLSGNQQLETLHFPENGREKIPDSSLVYDEKPFEKVLQQLEAYFNGTLTRFNVSLSLKGTDFQKQVWQALSEIEYGHTMTYSGIAEKIGNPKASRAVGMANNKNPVPIIIPCHRVIGKDGSLTGFGGGLDVKHFLLELEKNGSTQ